MSLFLFILDDSLAASNRVQKCAPWLVLLAVLVLPAAGQAQFTYVTNNGTITITKYTGTGGAVVIPATIDGLPVTTIGDAAFQECSTLTDITIPDSVTSIGDWAFYGCGSLTAVALPNGVTNIGNYGFNDCTALTNFPIPNSVTTIGALAFWYCSRLTSIAIPSSVSSIGEYACWHSSFWPVGRSELPLGVWTPLLRPGS